jgi:phosphatidylglycerophosphatase B
MIAMLSKQGKTCFQLPFVRQQALLCCSLCLWSRVALWLAQRQGQNATWLKMLYWITETVTQPCWGIITHVLLLRLVLMVLAFRFVPH